MKNKHSNQKSEKQKIIGKKAQLSTVARIMLVVVLLIVLFFALKGLMDRLFG